jgi:hypothetical protein
MHIIAKQSYRFHREGKEDYEVSPSRTPQAVPDDLKEDVMFERAIRDGSIVALDIRSATPEVPEAIERRPGFPGGKPIINDDPRFANMESPVGPVGSNVGAGFAGTGPVGSDGVVNPARDAAGNLIDPDSADVGNDSADKQSRRRNNK